MKAPRLTRIPGAGYDWKLNDGRIPWAEDGTQAAQHSMQRLLGSKGEYSLGGKLSGKDEQGTDFYGIIFKHSSSREELELEIKRRLLQTPGIKSIVKFESTIINNTLAVAGKGLTEWGIVDLSFETELL